MTRTARTLAAALLLLLGPATSPRAEVPLDGVAHDTAAFAAFNALAGQTRQGGRLPRFADNGAAVLGDLWNLDATLGKPPYGDADVHKLIGILRRHSQLFQDYTSFAPAPGAPPDRVANFILYQDEMAHVSAFLLPVGAATMSALAAMWAALPEQNRTAARLRAIRDTQRNFINMVSGMIRMAQGPTMRPGNRAMLTGAMAAYGPSFAAGLRPEDRATLAATVQAAVSAVPPDDQARLLTFLSALSNPACDSLCAVR